ncbi:MAG: NAD(P)-dependent oxidoreductase [Stappiaceae bacterium]
MTQSIGIFGLGLIGMAMANRLIAAGHHVNGSDPDKERCKLFSDAGGTVVSPAEIWTAPLVLSAVFSTEQLGTVIDSAPHETKSVLVSTSTCDPDQMVTLENRAERHGLTLVEAPISGTSQHVAQGTALYLLAGDSVGLDKFENIADALSPNRERVGDIGDGNRMKLAINLVLGLSRAAVAEGVVFAEALGLDPANYLRVAQRSAARSDVMASKGPKMVNRDFSPLGRIAQSHKDFRLIQEMASRHDHGGLPMVARYLEILRNADAAGESDLDNSAVFLAIGRAARGE